MCHRILRTTTANARIIQFTDLHMGEDADMRTLRLMSNILHTQAPVDLVVFTGDLVSGYALWDDAERMRMWRQALAVVGGMRIPFATLFGNHDDQPYHMDPVRLHRIWVMIATVMLLLLLLWRMKTNRKKLAIVIFLLLSIIATAPSDTTRAALLEYERRLYPDLSYTGGRNYCITLQTAQNLSYRLFFLDTGGGRVEPHLDVQWLRTFDAQPSLAFLHIPPAPHYGRALLCDGVALETPSQDLVIPDLELSSLGITAVFAGHDHGNAQCCILKGIKLCYGKHSGFGGYDLTDTRGARRIDLHKGQVRTAVVSYEPLGYKNGLRVATG